MARAATRFFVGAEVTPEAGPVSAAYLRLNGLSVLVGPNGAGKSSLLRELAKVLTDTRQFPGDIRGSVYVLVDDDELADIIAASRESSDDATAGFFESRRLGAGETYSLHRQREAEGEDLVVGALSEIETQIAPGDREAGILLDALSRSQLIRREGPRRWWCVDDPKAIGWTGADDSRDAPGYGDRPLPVVKVDEGTFTVFPRFEVLTAPSGLAQATSGARDSILSALFKSTEWPWDEDYEHVEDRDDLEWDDLERRAGRRIWLDDPESLTARIREEVHGACLMLGALATSLAPSFFKEQFELKLEVEPLVDWGATGPNLRLVIYDRHRDAEFSADAIADGFKLWIEIALAESIVIFNELHWNPHTSYTGEAIAQFLADSSTEGASPIEAFDGSRLAQVFQWPNIGTLFAAAGSEVRSMLVDLLLRFRGRGRIAYVIDEPERHLHPRLQRQAAAWLTEIVEHRGSQVIVATHSPHFLRSGPQAAFTYVHPTSTGSHALSFDPLEFDAFGAAAAEMGFDRGELLSGIELVLFVEGEADRRLLVATFGAELHQAGVVIVPIHGAKDAEGKGIVDSEMVLRFTSAKLAIMLDKVTLPTFLTLKTNRAARDAASGKSGSGIELRHLARTVQRALELDRDIELIPIGADDIFDLVDEEILRERFAFPGHDAARQIAADEQRKSGAKWKEVYRELWDINVLDMTLFDELGRQMAELERVPTQLRHVLHDLQRTVR